MGWFEEQIRQRSQSDQDVLEDSFYEMAGAVLNKWSASRAEDERLVAKEALDSILKYYHHKPAEIPESITELNAQIDYALRPTGLMVREVQLEEGWQKDAYGPMLGCLRDSGQTVALLPGSLWGYHYVDPDTGRKVRVTKKTAKLFETDALCFYKPMPLKKIGIPGLMHYMWQCVTRGDLILIILATLALTLVGKIEPSVYSMLTGRILKGKQINLMIGAGIFLVTSAFAYWLISVVKELLLDRISTKTTMAVQSSVMMRVLSLPVSFFRGFASGDLANRASCVDNLCNMILNMILNLGLTSLMSLLYLEAQEQGMSYAMLSGIQKIRLSGSEKRMFARWGRLYAKSAKLLYNPPLFIKLNELITLAITLGGTVLMYYLAVTTGVSDNEYYAFTAASGRLTGAFAALAAIAVSVAQIRPVLEMAEPILNAQPEVTEEKEIVTEVTGAVEVSHVTFRYGQNTPYVLKDLSLKIRAGEYVAIVGRTGCGKSTLVRLLLGFETPETGSVFYDQHDLANVDPRSLRKSIGVVIQNGELFQGDIFSNITISAPQLKMEDAWAAAERPWACRR